MVWVAESRATAGSSFWPTTAVTGVVEGELMTGARLNMVEVLWVATTKVGLMRKTESFVPEANL